MSKAPPSKQTPVAAAVKGLRGFVEVFKAGTHTDSKGRTVSFSQADLDQMIANHSLGAAPAVIGHPKDTAPAYAQVCEYKREGDSLFAKFDKINPAFEAGVESGAYYNRSLQVLKDDKHGWRVGHVGWLGAKPPAIDGLAPVEFAAADDDSCFEFAAPGRSLIWGLESAAKLLRRLRDRMIEKDGLQAADETLPQWEIDSMNESVTSARQQFDSENANPSLFNKPTGEDDMTITQADLDAAVAKARLEGETAGKTAAAADTVPKAEFAAKEQELMTFKKAEQKTRIQGLINGWKEKGLIVPAEETGLYEYMCEQEDKGQIFSFAKAEGGEGKKTPAEFFMDFMAARKPVMKLGAAGAGGAAEEPLDFSSAEAITAAAHEFMATEKAAGRVVNAAQAVQHVTTKGKKA